MSSSQTNPVAEPEPFRTPHSALRIPELLSPAGDWECARAAVENGADAIYFGLEKFNARMRAHNFTEADLPKLMEFLHRRGVKGYLTFNTLVFENEMAEAEQYLRTMIAAGVDAAVVQDVGICRLIRQLSPDFPIHVSTQMTITSAGGIEFARELGCNLVVLARECSLKEIEDIVQSPKSKVQSQEDATRNTQHAGSSPSSLALSPSPLPPPLPLEVFVHGALCVAYSGQCLTSEALGGRSANRGECAQACRMPYDLIADGQQVPLGNRKYLLSPQDLAGLGILPELVRLGVASLKIEGRLKSPEYVANITRVYRKALDEILVQSPVLPLLEGEGRGEGERSVLLQDSGSPNAPASSSDAPASPDTQHATRNTRRPSFPGTPQYEMEMAFSRGLYTGWFRGTNNQALVHAHFGKKRGVYLGEVTEVRRDSVLVRLVGPLKPGDGVVFDAGRPEEKEEGGRVYEVRNPKPEIRKKVEGPRPSAEASRFDSLGSKPCLRSPSPSHGEGARGRGANGLRPAPFSPSSSDGEGAGGRGGSRAGAPGCSPTPTHPESDSPEPRLVELFFGTGDVDFKRIHAGDKLWKTSDPELERRLRQSYEGDAPRFLRLISFQVHGLAGQPLTLIVRDGQGHAARLESSMPLVRAENQPLTTVRLREQLGRLGGTPFKLCELENLLEGDVLLPLSELNRLRREAVAELDAQRARPFRWTLGAPASLPASSPTVSRGGGRHDEQLAGKDAGTPSAAHLIVLVRNLPQLDAALSSRVETLYCDFEDPKKYREAVARFRNSALRTPHSALFVAPPRIFKMGEGWTLKQVRSCEADGYLVRNYDHLGFFAQDRRIGDYSLNIANRLTADYFRNRFGLERVTASYDLNFMQLEALLQAAPPEWFEVTVHQHIPMFHMEHCVFCAFLSQGTDYTNCGRPCDKHDLKLRDRVGAEHPVKADCGCRNTVFNALAQTGADYVSRMLALGVRHFRLEFLNETPEQVSRTIARYRQLLRGEITGPEIWRELKLLNQLGVTRGQMGVKQHA